MARPKFAHPNAETTDAGKARAAAAAETLRGLSRPPTFESAPHDDEREEKPSGALPEPEKKKRNAPPAPSTKRKR